MKFKIFGFWNTVFVTVIKDDERRVFPSLQLTIPSITVYYEDILCAGKRVNYFIARRPIATSS